MSQIDVFPRQGGAIMTTWVRMRTGRCWGRNERMSTPLEDYALLSDLRTGPLVSRTGSIDWLCLPRFDSQAVFSAILGDADDGRWQLSIVDGEVAERRYLPHTFVLETVWRSPGGKARVTEFLPPSTV